MQGSGNISLATCFAEEKGKNLDSNHAENNEENLDVCEGILFTANTKRKRACNVIMSESESDHDDDNEMNNSLTSTNLEADNVIDIRMPRRRLKTLRKIESKSPDNKSYHQSIPTNGDDELEEDLSYSEDGNMSDFIVDDFDVSDSEDMSNESQDESNSDAESNSGSLQDLQDINKDSYLQDVSDRKGSRNISLSTCSAAEKGKNFDSNYDQNNDEYSDLHEDLLCVVPSKRKQTRNVVISESENDDDNEGDDHLPISRLVQNHVKEISVDELVNVVDDDADDGEYDDDMPISQGMNKPRKRRLKPLRKCASKSDDGKTSSFIPTNDDDDDESEEDLSKGEEGNLNGFIVDDLDSDYSNDSQDLQDHRSENSDLQDVFDGEIDYREIISTIQRVKKPKIKWELKGDMLADFGKDAVLCMKAVCVINREQISKEQMYRETSYYHRGRGFNKYDVARGSDLAHFITDGNPQGDIKKTEAELLEFDSEGVEICRTLATRYVRQLYAIFKKNSDPFFP